MAEEKKEREIGFSPVLCTGCQACSELNPDIFGWDPETEKPFLKKRTAPEDVLRKAMACCREGCIFLADE
jgi:ferredoxin